MYIQSSLWPDYIIFKLPNIIGKLVDWIVVVCIGYVAGTCLCLNNKGTSNFNKHYNQLSFPHIFHGTSHLQRTKLSLCCKIQTNVFFCCVSLHVDIVRLCVAIVQSHSDHTWLSGWPGSASGEDYINTSSNILRHNNETRNANDRDIMKQVQVQSHKTNKKRHLFLFHIKIDSQQKYIC